MVILSKKEVSRLLFPSVKKIEGGLEHFTLIAPVVSQSLPGLILTVKPSYLLSCFQRRTQSENHLKNPTPFYNIFLHQCDIKLN